METTESILPGEELAHFTGTTGTIGTTALEALKRKLSELTSAIDRRKQIYLIDYPAYRNIGDMLINAGTEKFFDDYGYSVKKRYNLYDLPSTIPGVEKDDLFIFHGGGNFGDLYPEHLDALASVAHQFPNHEIIQFPQTIFFQSDQNREQRAEMLKKHGRTTIFVRDTRSLTSLQQAGVPNVHLMPDMAHQLYGSLAPDPTVPVTDNLFFFRKDMEANLLPSSIASNMAISVDWDHGIDLTDRFLCAFYIRSMRLTRHLGRAINLQPQWYKLRDDMIRTGTQLLSGAETIHTDRLHAMILALLIGRKVNWFDNSYGKLSSYVETWLRDIPTIDQAN